MIGFSLGHWLGVSLDSTFLRVGWVNLGFGIAGSILFSFTALWLTNIRTEK
jgi:hypothetical protein